MCKKTQFFYVFQILDPRIMVNSNKSPCTALSKDSQIYKTSDQGSTVLLCTCYQIHYNINGTKQKNLTVLAVTAEWVDGASVDTTLRIAEARICHPRKCCEAPLLRLKREDAGVSTKYFGSCNFEGYIDRLQITVRFFLTDKSDHKDRFFVGITTF